MSAQLPSFATRLVVAAQKDLAGVRLVGGSGLAALLGHRTSEDLDIFCATADDMRAVLSQLDAAAAAEGATMVSVRTAPAFRRFDIAGRDGTLRVDVAVDTAPLLDPNGPSVGGMRVLSLRDQRANKIVTLLGRSERRDLVDLYFLERAGWPFLEGLDDAVLKDAGVDFAWLAWALQQVEIAPLPGMLIALDLEDLRKFRDRSVDLLLDRAGAKS